jgi:preprotein translocase subunit SecF
MSTSVAEPRVAKTAKPKHESFAHRLYTSDFNIAFIKKRNLWYLISGIVILVCIASLAIRGLNLGIEFKGGSVFQVTTPVNSQTVAEYQEAVASSSVSGLDGSSVTTTGDDTVRIKVPTLTTDQVATLRAELAEKAGVSADAVNYQSIGPSWGSQITVKGIQALVIFLVLVALMIGIYFRNWKMSAAALIALAHDLVITIGVYSLSGFTVTPATITGVLTVLGYSLYDTVVVFDKVRENTADVLKRDVTYAYEANRAVNEVFVRSINTTIVGVLPVISILVAGIVWLGGQGPRPDIGLAMASGMIAGAWSSIFIATPLLVQLKEREPEQVAHRAALAKHERRTKPKVSVAVSETDQTITPATTTNVVITTATIPGTSSQESDRLVQATEESAAAGRPQPKKTSRSQRKKAK